MSTGTPTATEPSAGEEDELTRLGEAWEEFIVAVRRVRARVGERDDQLSLSQYEFVRPLIGGEGLPVSQLAGRFGVAPATATQILDALERAGIVARTRSVKDRRSVTVVLTEEGRRRVAQKRRNLAAQRRRFFANLAPEERANTERVLRHLARLIGEL